MADGPLRAFRRNVYFRDAEPNGILRLSRLYQGTRTGTNQQESAAQSIHEPALSFRLFFLKIRTGTYFVQADLDAVLLGVRQSNGRPLWIPGAS